MHNNTGGNMKRFVQTKKMNVKDKDLYLGSYKLADLAKTYKTPLIVVDENHLRENKPFCEQNTEAPSALRGSVNPRKPGQKASLTEDHPCNTEILKSCILSYG